MTRSRYAAKLGVAGDVCVLVISFDDDAVLVVQVSIQFLVGVRYEEQNMEVVPDE